MSQHHYLSLDCGTQSVRAQVFDDQGELCAMVQTPFVAYEAPQPGWSEQDPDYFWQTLAVTCRELWAGAGAAFRAKIRGVSLTTQRGTMINLDADGNPLRKAITWMDQREATKPPEPGILFGQMLKLVGAEDLIEHVICHAECNWIYQNELDVYEKTKAYLLLSGFLTLKLTGELRDSVGSQVGFLPFDYKKQRWLGRRHWKSKLLHIDLDTLPELIPQTQVMGRITSAAAEATGIPEGLPLIASGSDKACEVLGSGSLSAEMPSISFGTTATINVCSPHYFEAMPHMPAYPAAIPGYYAAEMQVQRGFWLVTWFKEQFGHEDVLAAEQEGCAPEEIFDRRIRDVPPGSDGLVIQPYWAPGVKYPPPEAKGAMIGFHVGHTRAHVYRALLEGLVFALKHGGDALSHKTKTEFRKIRIAGGGSRSDQAMQIAADVFNCPVERPHTHEASGLGAAMCVAVGLGHYTDLHAASEAMVRAGQRFDPIAANVKTYDQLYHHIFLPLYNTIKPLYQKIYDAGLDNMMG